jgi:hypothetical protein
LLFLGGLANSHGFSQVRAKESFRQQSRLNNNTIGKSSREMQVRTVLSTSIHAKDLKKRREFKCLNLPRPGPTPEMLKNDRLNHRILRKHEKTQPLENISNMRIEGGRGQRTYPDEFTVDIKQGLV